MRRKSWRTICSTHEHASLVLDGIISSEPPVSSYHIVRSEQVVRAPRHVRWTAIARSSVRIANVVAAAVLGILTARLLGPEGKGTYALPMIQAAIVATAFAGLTSATSYFLLNGDAGNRRTLAVALRASLPFLLGGALGSNT